MVSTAMLSQGLKSCSRWQTDACFTKMLNNVREANTEDKFRRREWKTINILKVTKSPSILNKIIVHRFPANTFLVLFFLNTSQRIVYSILVQTQSSGYSMFYAVAKLAQFSFESY